MGRGQSASIESNLLLGTELHEALRYRSGQELKQAATEERILRKRDFDQSTPISVVSLKNWIHEKLPDSAADTWVDRVLEAAPADADFEGFLDRLAVRRLREECLPLEGELDDQVREAVSAAIEQAIEALEAEDDRNELLAKAVVAAYPMNLSVKLSGAHAETWAAKSAMLSVAKWAPDSLALNAAAEAASRQKRGGAATARAAVISREAERFVDELEQLPARSD